MVNPTMKFHLCLEYDLLWPTKAVQSTRTLAKEQFGCSSARSWGAYHCLSSSPAFYCNALVLSVHCFPACDQSISKLKSYLRKILISVALTRSSLKATTNKFWGCQKVPTAGRATFFSVLRKLARFVAYGSSQFYVVCIQQSMVRFKQTAERRQ